MEDQAKSALALLSSAVTAVAGATASEHVMQVIFLVLGILGAICTLLLNLWRVYDKIKEAKKDGHIDEKESKDIQDAFEKTIEDLRDDVDEITKEDKKK